VIDIPVELVVAMTPDRLIGRDGKIPWRLSEDLKHFKALTTGHVVIMGRFTWESLGRPLPDRRNIIVSTTLADDDISEEVYGSLSAALFVLQEERDSGRLARDVRVFVIGGSGMYRAALEELDPAPARLHVTWVPSLPLLSRDVLFPIGEREILENYTETTRRSGEAEGVEYVVYTRAEPPVEGA
jgi:dihydrofolate reductase